MSAPRGVCSGGGVCSMGGACSMGVPAPGGVVSQHALRQTSPPHGQTDRCKKHNLRNFVADGKNLYSVDRLIANTWIYDLFLEIGRWQYSVLRTSR